MILKKLEELLQYNFSVGENYLITSYQKGYIVTCSKELIIEELDLITSENIIGDLVFYHYYIGI